MSTIITGDIIAVTAEFFNNGQQNLNTFHYRYDLLSGGSMTTAEAFTGLSARLNGVDNLFDSYAACLCNDITNIKWYMQVIYSIRFTKSAVLNDYDVGQNDEAPLPQNLAAVITMRGGIANRHNIGNKHIGSVPAAWVQFGAILETGLINYRNLASIAAAKVSNIAVGTKEFEATPVIYRRAAPQLSAEIETWVAQDTIRVMRRRTLRVGS
jgi:hypothetical protein